jgi:hypothetical protein
MDLNQKINPNTIKSIFAEILILRIMSYFPKNRSHPVSLKLFSVKLSYI